MAAWVLNQWPQNVFKLCSVVWKLCDLKALSKINCLVFANMADLSFPFPLCFLACIDLLADVSGLRQNFSTLLGTSLARLVWKSAKKTTDFKAFLLQLLDLFTFFLVGNLQLLCFEKLLCKEYLKCVKDYLLPMHEIKWFCVP